MQDWQQIARRQLELRDLPPAQREEVAREIAAHLEECYEQARLEEVDEDAAVERTLREVEDWRLLGADICRAKRQGDPMNKVTKTIWLPGIAILFAAGLVLLFLDRAALLQRIIWIACMGLLLCTAASEASRLNQRTRSLWLPAIVNLTLMGALLFTLDRLNLEEPGIATAGNIAKAFRAPWMLALPVLGAVGALLAKRARASRAERLIAGLAPSLVWLVVVAMTGLIFAFAPHDFSGVSLNDLALSAVGLVIIPGFALLLGALPFLRDSKTAAED
jgi:hypothetical protein